MGASPASESADLRAIDTWIFDLDNTLYPLGTEFVILIEGRMTAYVQQASMARRSPA